MRPSPVSSSPSPVPPRANAGWISLSCLGIAFVAFLVIAAIGAYAVARTGLVRVPYFSRFYRPPSPARIVDAITRVPAEFTEEIQRRLLAAPAAADGIREISITEEELTGLARGIAAERVSSTDVSIERIQSVVTESGIELSGSAKTKIGAIDALVSIQPFVDGEGNFSIAVQKASIGEWPMSAALMDRIRRLLLAKGGFEGIMKITSMNLKDIHLKDGSLTLVFGLSSSSASSTSTK